MRLWRAETLYVALVALLLLLAVWWFPARGQMNTDSYSVSTAGRKGLFQVLRRLDQDVSRSTDRLIPRPGAMDRLLILGPARYPNDREWDQLEEEVLDGGTLLLAASSQNPEFEAKLFGVRVVELDEWTKEKKEREAKLNPLGKKPEPAGEPPQGTPADLPPVAGDQADENAPDKDDPKKEVDVILELFRTPKARTFPVQTTLVGGEVLWKTTATLQLDAERGWETLLTMEQGPQVARRPYGLGTVVVCASDEVFSNESLLDAQQSLLAYRLIEACPQEEATWIDETLNGSGVPKILGILLDPLFRPLTLQMLLLAVLFGWLGARRFGPVEVVDRSRRRSIVEHAEALGILYYRAGAGSRVVDSMQEYFQLEVRRVCGSGVKPHDAQAIARQTRLDPDDVRSWLRQTEELEDGKLSPVTAGQMVRNLSKMIAALRQQS